MAAKNFSPLRMTAATEDAAVAQALQIVGAARDEVSVEVVAQDAKGVTVRVSPLREGETATATVSPTAPVAAQAAPEPVAAPVASVEEDNEADNALEGDADDDDDAVDDSVVESAGESEEAGSEPAMTMPFASGETSGSRDVATPVEAPKETRPIDPALQERAVATAQEFLDRMGMDARARAGEGSATDEAQRLSLDIEGEDVGILIGKHGQTLQAFQYLLNITLNNREGGDTNPLRVTVDAGGYRSRRAGSLQQVARDVAARSLRDRRPIRMEPMPAHERRLVHMALQEDGSITTSSEGREPMRCVVIAPAGYRAPEGGGGFNRGGNREGGNRGRGGFGGGFGGGNAGRGNSGFNRS